MKARGGGGRQGKRSRVCWEVGAWVGGEEKENLPRGWSIRSTERFGRDKAQRRSIRKQGEDKRYLKVWLAIEARVAIRMEHQESKE